MLVRATLIQETAHNIQQHISGEGNEKSKTYVSY